ncbi:MAG: hypothetical protein LBT56_05835, partial [Prevotellaceae bacterium]|nr:hypothetical protein [Prevotellaceae bacterium]
MNKNTINIKIAVLYFVIIVSVITISRYFILCSLINTLEGIKDTNSYIYLIFTDLVSDAKFAVEDFIRQ